MDDQVQIQGFRVELAEIEHVVRKKFNLKNTVALSNRNEKGFNSICLFVENFAQDTIKIQNYLRKKLPDYMIPSDIFNIPEFPVNTSSKIDKKALKTDLSNGKF